MKEVPHRPFLETGWVPVGALLATLDDVQVEDLCVEDDRVEEDGRVDEDGRADVDKVLGRTLDDGEPPPEQDPKPLIHPCPQYAFEVPQ